ncbi:hypothetical protein FRC12_020134 [Ceratobasidium sp. 428]|nr:hypothetical protein FRC12_020134 [Ceratobasidium sp. 428]
MLARELEFKALQEAAARLGLQLTPANDLPPPVNDAAPPYAPNNTIMSFTDPKAVTAPSESRAVQPPLEPPVTLSKGAGRAKPRMRTAPSEDQGAAPVPASTATTATGPTVTPANAPGIAPAPPPRAAPAVASRAASVNAPATPAEPAALKRPARKGPSGMCAESAAGGRATSVGSARSSKPAVSEPYPKISPAVFDSILAKVTQLRAPMEPFHVAWVDVRPDGSPNRGTGYDLQETFELETDQFWMIWSCPAVDIAKCITKQKPNGIVTRLMARSVAPAFPELDAYKGDYWILYDFAMAILRSRTNSLKQSKARLDANDGQRKKPGQKKVVKVEFDNKADKADEEAIKTNNEAIETNNEAIKAKKVKPAVKANKPIKIEADKAIKIESIKTNEDLGVESDKMELDNANDRNKAPIIAPGPQTLEDDIINRTMNEISRLNICSSDSDVEILSSPPRAKMLPDYLTTCPNKQPSSPRVKLEPAPRVTNQSNMQSPTHDSNITSTATSTASTMSTLTATATSAPAPSAPALSAPATSTPATRWPPGMLQSMKEYITSKMFSQMQDIWELPEEQRQGRFLSALSDLLLGKATPLPAKGTPGPGRAPMEFNSNPGSDGVLGADKGGQIEYAPEVDADIPVQDVEEPANRGRSGGGRGGRGGGSKKHGTDDPGVVGGSDVGKDAVVEGDGEGNGDGGEEADNTRNGQRHSTRTHSANDATDKGKAKAVAQPKAKVATRAGVRATSKSAASTGTNTSKSKK